MAAEILGDLGGLAAVQHASMRPRRMAAEMSDGNGRPVCHCLCFNEAAANGRGNRL